VIGGETVSLTQGTGVFANKNVGTGKTVTASGFSISGPDAANYSISQPTGLLANITAAPLTFSAMANSKVYDSTDDAPLSGIALSGVLGGDNLTLIQGIGKFADKNVGIGKAVSLQGFSVSGSDHANYNLTQPTGLLASIIARPMTLQVVKSRVNASTALSVPKSVVTYNAYGLVDSFSALGLINNPDIVPLNSATVQVLQGGVSITNNNYVLSAFIPGLLDLSPISLPNSTEMLLFGTDKISSNVQQSQQLNTVKSLIDRIQDVTKKVGTWFNRHVSLDPDIQNAFSIPEEDASSKKAP
jgi:hypothetical protein